ncbi:YbaK/EbsC family protein, partial [Ruegeria sp. 2012CJ41-6]
MSNSVKRVEQAAKSLGLGISVVLMPESTRTARDAATACNCDVGQITKSLIFEGAETGKLKLLLVSGKHDVNLDDAQAIFGEALNRADP